jgi:hypothetical protein
MATAKVETQVSVTLNLIGEEAGILRQILRNVGGSPDHKPRQLVDAILNALDEAEVDATNYGMTSQNAIYFS